jgi:hypothetical protein
MKSQWVFGRVACLLPRKNVMAVATRADHGKRVHICAQGRDKGVKEETNPQLLVEVQSLDHAIASFRY